MNKKTIVLCSALLLTLSASAVGVKYTITGKAPADQEGKYMYLSLFSNQADAPQDSALVSKGTFQFKGELTAPDMGMIADGKGRRAKNFLIALEQGAINVDFTADKGNVKGGLLNDRLKAYSEPVAALTQEQKNDTKLNELMAHYNDSLTTDEQRKETVRLYNAYKDKQGAIVRSVIDQNLDNVVGAFLLANYKSLYSNAECDALIQKAGKDFQNYPLVQSVMKQIAAVKKRSAGSPYMDFEQADAEGKMHKLSEYIGAGKYVLIDFWASWCGPCRAEMPNVKAAYDKYHPKGFEIVSVSLDNKKDAWLNAIEQLGMNWHHMSDLQGWKNAAAQLYGINSIPCTVLVGPDGIIVGGDYRGEDLDKKLGELLK